MAEGVRRVHGPPIGITRQDSHIASTGMRDPMVFAVPGGRALAGR